MKILVFLLALLKILGIVLLSIVLILIIILTLVLLVPINYDIRAEKSDKLYAKICLKWFLGIIHFKYSISDRNKKSILKIFGITLHKNKEIFKTEDTTYEKPVSSFEKDLNNEDNKTNSDNYHYENPIEEKTEKMQSSIDLKKNTKKHKSKIKETNINKKIKEELKKEEKKFIEETEEIDKHSIIDKIKEIINYPDREKIQKLFLKLTKKLFKILFPDNIYIDIEYGSDDPSNTGYVLAISSILVLYFGNNINVRGNFQQRTLNGKIQISGKLFLGRILQTLLIFIISKPIRNIIWKYLKNRKKEKNKWEQI